MDFVFFLELNDELFSQVNIESEPNNRLRRYDCSFCSVSPQRKEDCNSWCIRNHFMAGDCKYDPLEKKSKCTCMNEHK